MCERKERQTERERWLGTLGLRFFRKTFLKDKIEGRREIEERKGISFNQTNKMHS